ncbi:methyltransferase family protein [Phytoactinopolyspora mesophila]|uniref:Isoprenylcysteine carboxylmethyltransferase family protein n=1 Tax=Phytoactinopolyspora mesophila TaxID=2650750 RepID=A0A7K3M2P4_9ACTN|nr:isoprenylcysteine carboxylmethyltransferase family protein [Phytoactinopolyspora mesophila]NDL57573.1 isoprenylcysteine carboxylmethyltransferase family protein [Phytoactinopolyspora mesophila]
MRYARVRNLWERVPLPAETAGAMVLGALLQRWRPVTLPGYLRAPGMTLVVAGVVLAGRATLERGPGSLDEPQFLATSGVHGWSRNPMYVGCEALHLGLALATRNAWTAATWPVSALLLHRWVFREEGWLLEWFGREYEEYRMHVPRYAGRRRSRHR